MENKMLNAIKIDVERQEVYSIEVEKSLNGYYNAIGNDCSLIEVATYLPSKKSRFGDVVYVDEEGLMKKPMGYFTLFGRTYVNNAIILGSEETDDGVESTHTSYSVEEIQGLVGFVG